MAEHSLNPQARRSWFNLAAAVLLSAALAACQVVPREPTRPVPPPQRPQDQPDPGQLPPDEERNRVAVLVPLSGPNAGVGESLANAANLALLDTGGQRIRITIYDTAKGGAVAAANEALAQGNRLFLGPLLAEDVRQNAGTARRADVPVLAYSNDTDVAGNGVYLMGFTPGQSISRVVEHARSQGAVRFAALIPQGLYGQRASQAMIEAVERTGGRMIAMQTFDRTPAAARAAVARLNAQGSYDAVLIADSGQIAAAAATALKASAARNARILGTELWAAETNLSATRALHGAWFASPSDAMFNQFRTRYRARYGAAPYRLSSLGYDSVLLAVRVGADWRVGRDFPERALTDPGGFVGVDGVFRFGRDGVAERALQVQQVNSNGLSVVSPAPKSFGD